MGLSMVDKVVGNPCLLAIFFVFCIYVFIESQQQEHKNKNNNRITYENAYACMYNILTCALSVGIYVTMC